ncbi:hypothetical protein MMC30_008151 [Trapelia coarctata]|nr:hypothetical protein [Trapelia coarctata]
MPETVRVMGVPHVGKATLMGNLIYKCGLDLRMMEQLQRENISAYSGLVKYYKTQGISPSFKTRNHSFAFTDINTPECLIYMIDASNPAQMLDGSDKAVDATSLADVLKKAKNLIVLVNKMDEISWSEKKYIDIVKAFGAQLKELGFDLRKVKTIPISALHGDNILDPSSKSPWYKELAEGSLEKEPSWTVIQAMDE